MDVRWKRRRDGRGRREKVVQVAGSSVLRHAGWWVAREEDPLSIGAGPIFAKLGVRARRSRDRDVSNEDRGRERK